jgi:hypothetical protein
MGVFIHVSAHRMYGYGSNSEFDLGPGTCKVTVRERSTQSTQLSLGYSHDCCLVAMCLRGVFYNIPGPDLMILIKRT